MSLPSPALIELLDRRFGNVWISHGGAQVNVSCPFCPGKGMGVDATGHLGLNFEKNGGVYHCTSGDTLVWLADGTQKTMREIVDNQLPVEVVSFNTETGELGRGKVVSWFKKEANPDEWEVLMIKPDRRHRAKNVVSSDHRMWTRNGYKPASDLDTSDEMLTLRREMTPEGLDALCGLWMGDGHIPKRGDLVVNHGGPQEEYARYIAARFGVEVKSKEVWTKVPSSPIKKCYMRHRFRYPLPNNADFMLQPTVEKALAGIGPLGLALWFCDDGNTRNVKPTEAKPWGKEDGYFYARLHTESFDPVEMQQIIDWFRHTHGIPWVGEPRSNTDGSVLVCRDSEAFYRLIAPYVPQCMQHKLPPSFRTAETLTDGFVFSTVSTAYCSGIERRLGKKKRGIVGDLTYRYDIEVEGNHNFFAATEARTTPLLHSNCVKCDAGGKGLATFLEKNGVDKHMFSLGGIGLGDLRNLSSILQAKPPKYVPPTIEREQLPRLRRMVPEDFGPEPTVWGASLVRKGITWEEADKYALCVGLGKHNEYVIFPFFESLDDEIPNYWQGRDATGTAFLRKLNPSNEECPQGKAHWLYGFEFAARESDVYLVEGTLDAISLQSWLDARRGPGHVALGLQGTAFSFPSQDIHPLNSQYGKLASLKPRKVWSLLDGDAWKKSKALADILCSCGFDAEAIRLYNGDPNELVTKNPDVLESYFSPSKALIHAIATATYLS